MLSHQLDAKEQRLHRMQLNSREAMDLQQDIMNERRALQSKMREVELHNQSKFAVFEKVQVFEYPVSLSPLANTQLEDECERLRRELTRLKEEHEW